MNLLQIKAIGTSNGIRLINGEHLVIDANPTPISSRIEAEIILCDAEEAFPEMKFEIRKLEV